jgi:CubicO group peptidase (beta-lactamase class C family)
MKSIFTLWSLMILLTYQSLKGQGFSPELQSRFQHIIDSFQNNPANPYVGGMAVAVKVDRVAEWQGATGYAARNIDAQNNLLPGGTAFSVSNLSRIYSVTKTFTASLTLELANAGVFNLDDQIIRYLPLLSAVNPGLNTFVTIRQLTGS